MDLIRTLNENSDVISVISAVITAITIIALAIITAQYAAYTKTLVTTARDQKKVAQNQLRTSLEQLNLEYIPNIILTGADEREEPFYILHLTNLGRHSMFFQYATR